MFLFTFLLFQGDFDPDFFAPRYSQRFNLDRMTFKCLRERKIISIDDINDEICQCCDGSDEVFNNSFSCPSTCPIELSKSDIKTLQTIYNRAIVNRIALGKQGAALYNELAARNNETAAERDKLREKLAPLTEELKTLEAQVRKWAYESNGLREPTAAEKAKAREEYANSVNLFDIQQKRSDDEEEGEGYEPPKIDEAALEAKKERRREKWDWMQEIEYNNLLNTAIDKGVKELNKQTQPKANDFLSKLKATTEKPKYPEVYQHFLDVQGEYNESSKKYQQTKNDVFNNEMRLNIDYGEDYQWFESFGKIIEGTISGTRNKFLLTLLQRATVRVSNPSSVRSIDYGNYVERKGNLLIYNVDHENFAGKRILKVKTICYPERKLFEANDNTRLHLEAVIGLPEICPSQFVEDLFVDWLKEIQFYSDIVLENQFYSETL